MSGSAEKDQSNTERAPLPTREKDPLQHDLEIEEQAPLYESTFASFKEQLQGKVLAEAAPQLAQALLKEGGSELAIATKFFALATAVEVIRTKDQHQQNWEQAAAALHIIFPYSSREPQRIQMATGEGKTFTIALASLWKALQGEFVTVHTDKKANVDQSISKTSELYEIFGVSYGSIADAETMGADYEKYLNGQPPYDHLPLIRYGVWGQGIHEYLSRQQLIFKYEAALRGDRFEQFGGGTLRPEMAPHVEAALAYQKRLLLPDVLPIDEGDLSLDMEESPVVLAGPDVEGFSAVELAEYRLAWQFFADQQPAQGDRPGTLDYISTALDYDRAAVERQYKVEPVRQVEGLGKKDDRYAVTAEGVDLLPETFYLAKLVEATVVPSMLVQVLEFTQLQQREGAGGEPPLPPESIKKVLEIAQTAATNTEPINWSAVAAALPPLRREQLQQFFSDQNPVFAYRGILDGSPELRQLLQEPNPQLDEHDWQTLRQLFGKNFDQLVQRLTIVRLIEVIQPIWELLFSKYSNDIFTTRYLMNEGDDYQFETLENAEGQERQEVVLLGADRQPQPGKELQDNYQVFLHLKHGLEMPLAQKTIAQIMPITWYQMAARHGTEVSSISGTQDEPDYVVESTGKSSVEVLPTRVLGNKEEKLRAIAQYAEMHAQSPILLCAQDVDELKVLEAALNALPGRQLELLDAAHAGEAAEKVPKLQAGMILLLQITARGLDFGRLLNDGQGHTFENGLIISAAPLPDPHQQRQMEGRLGGKRPSGRVVTFTSLDDKVAQQYYLISPKTSQRRHTQMTELNRAYSDAISAELFEEDTLELDWPKSFSEAMVAVEAWEEAVALAEKSETTPPAPPLWMELLLGESTRSPELQELSERLQPRFRALIHRYDALRRSQIKDLERQQNNNLKKMYESRREQMVIDVVVQNLWQEIMNPTAETPLGKKLLPLTFEQRQALVERVFDEAHLLYPLSLYQIKEDAQASRATKEETRMAQFMKDLSEQVSIWVDTEQTEQDYVALLQRNKELTPPFDLPESVHQLPEWLEQNQPLIPKQPGRISKALTSATRALFLGARLFSQPENLEPLAPLPVSEPIEPARRDLIQTLEEFARKEFEFRRKFHAEK